jgi:hypothetical protein
MSGRPLSNIQLIEAVRSYTSPEECQHLSFRKGQLFYCLAHDPHTKTYFVSTQYSTPFARQAVNGWVPDGCFRPVDMAMLRGGAGADAGMGARAAAAAADRPTAMSR